jgi:FAD/FMN-containing dehydrogenase
MSIHEPVVGRLDVADLTDLAARVAGPVLPGDHPDVDVEVATFNLAVRHRPAVVVGATSAEDVAAAVGWAALRGLPVAVQSTGHGPVQPVTDALMITTSRMATVEVDADRRTAVVGAGARWHQVQAAAAPYGLAGLSGSSSHVGVVGFVTGGGMGPMSRRFGFGADLVRSLDLVTADGRIHRVDENHEPDLFWAIRGGKGNFGIVTALEIDLVPVADVYGGAVFFSGDSAREVLHSFRAWAPTLPERAGASVALLQLPPAEELPEPIRGRYVVQLRFSLVGASAEGEELLAPMLDAGEVLLSGVGALPVTGLDAIHQDPTDPMPIWERGGLLGSLPAEAVDALLDAAGPDSGSDLAMVEVRLMGGALGRQPRVPNAVAGREGAYSLFTLGVLAPGAAEAVQASGAAVHAALEAWSTGTVLVNWLGDATTPEEVARAWTPEVHARLLRIKHEFDPTNLFRFGHALA